MDTLGIDVDATAGDNAKTFKKMTNETGAFTYTEIAAWFKALSRISGLFSRGRFGAGRWRFADGGGDISVSRRAFLGRLLRLDGAKTARGEQRVGTRWKGVVGTVARHTPQCLPAGCVRV